MFFAIDPQSDTAIYQQIVNAVCADIRAGRLESKMVPLQATSDVMHILDRVRKQIGLEYTELE